MADCILPQLTTEEINQNVRYRNRIHQIKKEQHLGKHFGSNKRVGMLSRKK